jgi:hypothetical protein
MGWTIVNAYALPLGRRILRWGFFGHDVRRLQELLHRANFYFGKVDGYFGALTEEALILYQRVYNLRADGVAGPEVFQALVSNFKKTGRVIYTIKLRENLNTIAEKFSVRKTAIRGVPGQGNPHQRLYPGMRLLLHEKALFAWDESAGEPRGNPNMTGMIRPGWRIEPEGDLTNLAGNYDLNWYYLLEAETEVWERILSSRKCWGKLVSHLGKRKILKFGLDFRNASPGTIFHWLDFLKFLCGNLRLKELSFIVLPLLPEEKGAAGQLYWLNLPLLSKYTGLVMFEPVFNLEAPSDCEASAFNLAKTLRKLVGIGLSDKALLVSQVSGWDWNLDQNTHREVPYKEARIIRAMNYRAAGYSPSKYTKLNYLNRGERHCLIYRDDKGWAEFFAMIVKTNLLGAVVRNFNDLGEAGSELVANTFAVLPAGKV